MLFGGRKVDYRDKHSPNHRQAHLPHELRLCVHYDEIGWRRFTHKLNQSKPERTPTNRSPFFIERTQK
jgi:hypothetical protein